VKTAVSLPDDLYRLAEAAARKLKMSRSELYAAAISEFLTRRQASRITERLNETYSLLYEFKCRSMSRHWPRNK
jgi:metal-responsive CopG/Arc/MetJ family transcriptional regulator